MTYTLCPTGAASTVCVHQYSTRLTADTYNNTKARRARELRPRRNFLKNEEVESHRLSPLQDKPVVEEHIDARPPRQQSSRDFRYAYVSIIQVQECFEQE